MAGDFVSQLKPTCYIAKLLGIVYFKMNKSEGIVGKILDCLWPVPFLIFYLFCMKFGIKLFKESDYPGLIKEADFLLICWSTINMVLRPILYVYKRNSIKRLMEDIEEVGRLNKTGWPNITSSFPVFVIIANTIWFLLGFCFSCWPRSSQHSYFHIVDDYFATYGINFFVGCYETFFIHKLLEGLRSTFHTINCEIIKESSAGDGKLKISSVVVWTRIHYDNVLVSQKANRIFQDVVLLWLASVFIFLVANVNYLAITVKSGFFAQPISTFLYSELSWMAMIAGILTVLVNSWDLLAQESNKTYVYLHDVYYNHYPLEARMEGHLHLMSLQLASTRLSFTAHGFFAIDWTLAIRMLGAVTTYTIIMIQLELNL